MSWFIRDWKCNDQMLIDERGHLFKWPSEGPAVEICKPEEFAKLNKIGDQHLLFGITATVFECTSGGDRVRRITWNRDSYFEPYKLYSEGEE